MLLPFHALLYFALLSNADPAPADPQKPLIANGTNYIPPAPIHLNPNAPPFTVSHSLNFRGSYTNPSTSPRLNSKI